MKRDAATIEISDTAALVRAPLVSVYMLAYRHERFLAQAIEGVIAQVAEFPIELVIGEDHSPDRTRSIAIEYQQRHPTLIRVLTSEANVGARANAARCQAALRGEFVAICEGDDYWCDPTKLARQMEIFRRRPDCSLVFHAANIVDGATNRTLTTIRWPPRTRRFTTKELILGDGGLVPTASILIQRSVLQRRPDWALAAPVGDYPMVLWASLCGEVIYLDRIMSAYRSNVPHSWTQRHTPSFANRFNYASQIDTMLSAMQEQIPESERGPVRTTISKYYSDVVVRLDGSQDERAAIYAQVKDKMQGSDRVLAWLASRFGIRLPWVKDLIRKSKTLLRMLAAQFRRGLES